MKTDWTNYEKRIEACKPKMIKAMKFLAGELGIDPSEIWEDDCDNFRISFSVIRDNSDKEDYQNRLDVTFAIWDSGDADDGIHGEHGNFIFDLVEEGGRIVGSCIPENYSDGVWIDYKDESTWNSRLAMMIAGLPESIRLIEQWKEEN